MLARRGRQPQTVLLVAKVRAGGHAYYLEPTPATGRTVEEPGRWVGRGSADLGLGGDVSPQSLEAVLAGNDASGMPLPGADRRRVAVAAYDLTFCAPKSVSLLHALSDTELARAVHAGHGRAVDAGIGYLEDRALAVRRPSAEARRVPVESSGTPAAAFVHLTSRALDPHLHTHVVVANVGRGPEGSWSALDGRGLYAHAAAAGALYQAQLRYELTTTLGVAWGPLRHGRADVEGISPEARRAFSQRSEQIASHLASRGLGPADDARVSRRATYVAGLATRPAKDLVGSDELRPWWRARARAVGMSPRRLEAVLDRMPRRAADAEHVPRVDEATVVSALATVRHVDRAFSRRDVVRAWSATRPAGAPVDSVAAVVNGFMAKVGRQGPEGPGVAEARVELPEQLRRTELELLLERRGVALDRDADRDLGRGVGRTRVLGRAADLGLGL